MVGKPSTGSGYYRSPNDLIRKHARALTVYGIAIYSVLAMHANSDGICWPTQKTIAGYFGLSRFTVRLHLRELEQLGLIHMIRSGKRGRIKYQLTAPFYRSEWSTTDLENGQPLTTNNTHKKTKGDAQSRAPPLTETTYSPRTP